MELSSVLRMRRSVRSYSGKQISEEQLSQILDAAQLAPVAGNNHTGIHITVIQDPAVLEKLRRACLFQRHDGSCFDPLYGVPTLILLHAAVPGQDDFCSAGCIIENMALAAADLGLGSVILTGYQFRLRQHPALFSDLEIPTGSSVLVSLGVGCTDLPMAVRSPEPLFQISRL